jgi:phosphatidylinositol alpha-mannosyltransferase
VKVVVVCPYSVSARGGVQKHALELAAELRARGVEADVLAPSERDVDVPGFVSAGRSVPIPDAGTVCRVALTPSAIARTARLVADARYDVVHVHEPVVPAVSLTAVVAARAPLVGTFHIYAASRRWYRPFARVCRRAVARLSARIAVSAAARDHVSRTYAGEYRIIPNGLDVRAFAALPTERDGSRIVFIGRADARKGLPVLIEAFGKLSSDARLELVGVGERDLRGVRLPAGRELRAYGDVSEEAKRRVLARAAVLCAPSLYGESFGLVLAEAMAAGVPVVASALPGYRDVLREGGGRLVPPGDAEALARELDALLGDDDLRAAIGEAGREAARRFDWARVADDILEVYDDVLGRRRGVGRDQLMRRRAA